ncbi:MAG: S53 family peptidase [Chthoniobacterales bacterium]
MQGLLKTLGRSSSAHLVGGVVNRRRLGSLALGGLASASLLLSSGAAFAALSTFSLNPLVSKSTLVSPTDDSKIIGVGLSIPSSDPAGLKAFVDHVSTPGDAMFHKFITSDEFAARFGGNAADYQSLKDWAAKNGLTISQESKARNLLTVRGTVATFNRLFQTQINNYKTSDGVTFYSAGIKPIVPTELASKVQAVIGLTSGKPIAAQAKVGKALGENPAANSALKPADRAEALGTGPGGTYGPEDLRTAYSIPTWGKLEPGQVMGIFEQGYYNPKDVDFYNTHFKAGSHIKQTAVSVDGSPITLEGAIELEACLDVDMIIAANPSVAEVIVYIDDYTYDPFDVAITDAYTAIADANVVSVVSASYGEDEQAFIDDGTESALDTALQEVAAVGISSFASSGDDGAYGDGYNFPYNVENPGTDPYNTSVGGTELLTTKGENYEFEYVYNEFPYYGGSGGGISVNWTQPAYQNYPYTGYTAGNGGSTTMRNVPDVAAEAGVLTGVAVYVSDQGGWFQVGGTSVASPLWAGYLTNINAAFHYVGLPNVGQFNPVLYTVGLNQGGTPADYMYDIVNGNNGYIPFYGSAYPGYYAGFGYSNCTGNGSIWGGGFGVQMLLSGKQAGTPPGSFTVTPKATKTPFYSYTIKWTPSSGASGYGIALYHSGALYNNAIGYVANGSTVKYTFYGLTASTFYYVYMWGFNASGGSPYATTSFTTAKLP